jgi:hypothetical protein
MEEIFVGLLRGTIGGSISCSSTSKHDVKEYEIKFTELVKYVSYMDIDQREVEHFFYGLNPKIRAMIWMWKPLSVVEAV